MHIMVKCCVIYITGNGFVEASIHLLQSGVPYVLSQNFCQDPLEEHFGRHRGRGRRSDNPTLYQFGQVVNTYGHSFIQKPVHPSFGRVKRIWTGRNMGGKAVDAVDG